MVTLDFHPDFKKSFSKIRDKMLKERLIKQFGKIRENPETGKPMMYARKGTRDVHVPPFRLSYQYLKDEDKVIFLDLYHKDEQ